jgi:biotin carboxyl carrier protein
MRRYELDIRGKRFSIAVRSFSRTRAELEIDGVHYAVDVTGIVTEGIDEMPAGIGATARALPAGVAPARPGGAPGRGATERGTPVAGAGSVTAPIPGQILAILVKEEEAVTAGQPLLKIEAMKMENTISAPVAGTVKLIGVSVGDAVTQGQELLVIR